MVLSRADGGVRGFSLEGLAVNIECWEERESD